MVVIHSAYTAASLLAATFLSIFLWRATHDLTQIALFSGMTALLIPVVFLANGVLWPRLDAGASIQLGLLGNGLVYLVVLQLGGDSASWIFPLGILRGIGEGFYWSGYHLVSYDTTSDGDRDRYFGAMAAGNWILTAGLPPVAGAIIAMGTNWGNAYRGYQAVFGLASILLIGGMVLAGRLRCGHRQTFSVTDLARLQRRNPDWQWVTRARLADGLTGSLSGLVLTVLMFLVLTDEQAVGNFNGLVGLLGVGISLALAVFMRPRYRMTCALIGAALLVLSTLVLPLYLTAWALIAFGLLRALGGPLHGNALAPVALYVIDRDPEARQMRYEYIVHQEICLGIGRVLSIGCFLLLLAPLGQLMLARVVVVIAGAAPMLIWAAFARIPAAAPEAENRALPAAA
jgi:YQGE family putative transporter